MKSFYNDMGRSRMTQDSSIAVTKKLYPLIISYFKFGFVSLFNSISTFVGYLMLKLFS